MTFIDWTIIAVFLIGLISIGFLFSKRNKNLEDYFLGGRSMPTWLVAFAATGTSISAGTFVGSPGSIYKNGMSWGAVVPGQMLMNLMVLGVVGKKIAIVSRRRNLQSFVGLLYDRYNKNKPLAIIAALIILVFVGYYTPPSLSAEGGCSR